jgi:superfamily II RNA helicase
VVFTSMEKFDGTSFRPLTPPEVKQIAGRAGRYGSKFACGQVTCLNEVRGRSFAEEHTHTLRQMSTGDRFWQM